MDKSKKIKVEKFLSDELMVNAIYGIIHDSFLKGKGQRDIQILAAERLAIDFLDDAWKELEKFKGEDSVVHSPIRQVGL